MVFAKNNLASSKRVLLLYGSLALLSLLIVLGGLATYISSFSGQRCNLKPAGGKIPTGQTTLKTDGTVASGTPRLSTEAVGFLGLAPAKIVFGVVAVVAGLLIVGLIVLLVVSLLNKEVQPVVEQAEVAAEEEEEEELPWWYSYPVIGAGILAGICALAGIVWLATRTEKPPFDPCLDKKLDDKVAASVREYYQHIRANKKLGEGNANDVKITFKKIDSDGSSSVDKPCSGSSKINLLFNYFYAQLFFATLDQNEVNEREFRIPIVIIDKDNNHRMFLMRPTEGRCKHYLVANVCELIQQKIDQITAACTDFKTQPYTPDSEPDPWFGMNILTTEGQEYVRKELRTEEERKEEWEAAEKKKALQGKKQGS